MKIYGHTKGGNELEELTEIAFQSEPDKLKEIAKFLNKMAIELENDKENFGHGHAKDYCENWGDGNPEIIVFPPNS